MLGLSRVTGGIGGWYLVGVEAASITLYAILLSALVAAVVEVVTGLATRTPESGAPRRRDSRAGRSTVCTALAFVALLLATINLRQPYAETTTADAAHRVLPLIEDRIGDGPVLIEGRWALNAWVYSVLALELERSGHDVSVSTIRGAKFPADMEDPPPPGARRFVVFDDVDPDLRWSQGVEVIADFDYSLDPDEPPTRLTVVEAPLDSPVQDPA